MGFRGFLLYDSDCLFSGWFHFGGWCTMLVAGGFGAWVCAGD